MCHQKHSSLCWSVFSCIPCEESNRAVRRSTQKQSSGLFFSPREIPACVTRNTPAYAGVFFRVSCARNRTGQCAAAHKNSPVDCFLARGRFPRVSPKNTPAYAGVFFRVSRARNRTRRCAGAFVRDNGTLCFWLYP